MTQIYGIAAHPVSHSLSPPMQNAGFTALGINAEFQRFDVKPENLPDFIEKVRSENIRGLAVSLPNKEIIIPLLDKISGKAQKIGAVNTVYWDGEKLCGENTDADGFLQSVNDQLRITNEKEARNSLLKTRDSSSELRASSQDNLKSKFKNLKSAILGAGGAGRAMAYALKEAGAYVTIYNRTEKKAKSLAEEFEVEWGSLDNFQAKNFDLVANSTSVGLKEWKSPVSESSWEGFLGIAFDAVFDPLITKFLEDAKNIRGKIITGEKMLLFQGVRQFEIWTGKKAPVEKMKKGLGICLQK